MTQINNPLLPKYHNEEHFQHIKDVKGVISKHKATILNDKPDLVKAYGVLSYLIDEEDKTLEVIRKSVRTPEIQKKNQERKRSYTSFCFYTKAFLPNADEEKAKAAEKIMNVLNHYRDVYNKPYNKETAMIYNLLQELEENYAAEVTLIKAGRWVEELKTANTEFEKLMNARHDEKAKYADLDMRKIRKEIDVVYRGIINSLNLSLQLDTEGKLTEFANEINERINYYNNTILTRQGVNKKKREQI